MKEEKEWWRNIDEEEYAKRIYKAKEEYHKRMARLPFEEKLKELSKARELAKLMKEGKKGDKFCKYCGAKLKN